LDDSELPRALAEGWGIAVTSAAYAPVGFGSYHWVVTSTDQQRFFVTVDDLRHKRWLGDTCDSVFVGFRSAFDTAVALRDRRGLAFVHAPLATIGGESVRRIGRCHSIAVFAFIDGEAGGFAARNDLDRAWHGGPFAEPARVRGRTIWSRSVVAWRGGC